MSLTDVKIETIFNQRNAIMVPKTQSKNPVSADTAAAFYLELFSLGFRLTGEAYDAVLRMSEPRFKSTTRLIIAQIKKRLGMNVKYNVLYKGFPDEVPDFDTYNFLRFCAFLGNEFGVPPEGETLECGHAVHGPYLSADAFGACPVCQMSDSSLAQDGGALYKNINKRLKFLKSNKVKVTDVHALTEDAFNDIVTNLMASKSSLLDADQRDLNVAFREIPKDTLDALIPSEFGFKEVLAQCVGLYASRFSRAETIETFGQHVKTAPDVLRVAKEFRDRPLKKDDATYTVEDGFINKDGDKTRVKYKLNNSQRKLIVGLLDKVADPCPDMIQDRMDWVHLNKSVHFGQFKDKYPNAFQATDRLFNHPETITTFDSVYESLLVSTDTDALIKHLVQRPGFFARVLHSVLRKHKGSAKKILNAFGSVAAEASMRTLVSLNNLFKAELRGFKDRLYIDSETTKAKLIGTERPSLSDDINQLALDIVLGAIKAKLKSPEKVSRVLIDPCLHNFKLPLKLRDVATSKEKRERGSIVPVDQGKTVRLYIYWHESGDSGRVDLDLSVTLYSDSFNNIVETSSFSRMNSHGSCMRHSGDIQSAPNGASEMVDINVEKALSKGARYALMYVNSYAGSSFSSFESFAGVQSGDNLGGQKKINPLKVESRFDFSGSGRSCVAAIYDLKKGEIIHGNVSADALAGETVFGASDTNTIVGRFLINEAETSMSIYDYLDLFAQANGAEVVNEAEPDVEYDYKFGYATSQNIDEFNSKWLQ